MGTYPAKAALADAAAAVTHAILYPPAWCRVHPMGLGGCRPHHQPGLAYARQQPA
jgi:hypothetical protein